MVARSLADVGAEKYEGLGTGRCNESPTSAEIAAPILAGVVIDAS